jgi:ankyrin repeat protein
MTSSQEVISFLKSEANVEASSQALMAHKPYFDITDSQRAPRKITGLHVAGYFGVSKATDTLLELGHPPNLKDTYNRTPLWYAAQNGYEAVVEKLLTAGADVNTAGTDDKGCIQTVLQVAAGGGHLAVVEKLLAVGANVNAAAASFTGGTALQAAAGRGHLAVVEKLLAVGANVNAAADWYGGTALQLAAGGGHLDVVEMLLTVGADVDAATDFYGRTALKAAAGHLKVTNRLKAAGAWR